MFFSCKCGKKETSHLCEMSHLINKQPLRWLHCKLAVGRLQLAGVRGSFLQEDYFWKCVVKLVVNACGFKLKVVSATFLLVCFVCLKERTCETRNNVFYFTSKTLFVLEIIKF